MEKLIRKIKKEKIENCFSTSNLVLFSLGKTSDYLKKKIGRRLILDDNLLETFRNIRRVQREVGADYDKIMERLG